MEQKRLTKSLSNKVFAGVAGGIAEYFDTDPVLVRIAFVIATFVNGIGLIAYIIGMIAIPKPDYRTFYQPAGKPEGSEGTEAGANIVPEQVPVKKEKSPVFGFVLIGIGFLLLMNNLFPHFAFKSVFPVVVILIGTLILFRSAKKERVRE